MITKIIATIGPASFDYKTLKGMRDAGMSIARINTKYAPISDVARLKVMTDKLGCKLLVDINNLSVINDLKLIDFDYLALAFTQSASQIKMVKSLFGKKIFLISKIEDKKGVSNVNSITRATDGLMVARGDLGGNVPLAKLPVIQKLLIKKCNAAGKFVITATEMLLSMVSSKTPEKAEVSDVANAVLDGSDALMLSEETAIGKHPIIVVKLMSGVIREAEKFKNKLKNH